jgi:hypothetical protein
MAFRALVTILRLGASVYTSFFTASTANGAVIEVRGLCNICSSSDDPQKYSITHTLTMPKTVCRAAASCCRSSSGDGAGGAVGILASIPWVGDGFYIRPPNMVAGYRWIGGVCVAREVV